MNLQWRGLRAVSQFLYRCETMTNPAMTLNDLGADVPGCSIHGPVYNGARVFRDALRSTVLQLAPSALEDLNDLGPLRRGVADVASYTRSREIRSEQHQSTLRRMRNPASGPIELSAARCCHSEADQRPRKTMDDTLALLRVDIPTRAANSSPLCRGGITHSKGGRSPHVC